MGKKNFTEQEVEDTTPATEMAAAEAEMAATPADATLPEGEPKDERKFYLSDGTECNKSAFIRDQFTVLNKSRQQIVDEFDIPYRTVYGATVNMTNSAEPATRGRAATFSRINVTESGDVVTFKDEVLFLNNVEQKLGTEVPAFTEVDRNTWIKEQVAAGKDRGAIAKALDLSYGVIYNLTKEAEGARSKNEVTLEDGTVVSRAEYIRQLHAAGMPKGEIAKKLNVEYSIVWQATKATKSDEERFASHITALEGFLDLVEVPEALSGIIGQLKDITFKKTATEGEGEQA